MEQTSHREITCGKFSNSPKVKYFNKYTLIFIIIIILGCGQRGSANIYCHDNISTVPKWACTGTTTCFVPSYFSASDYHHHNYKSMFVSFLILWSWTNWMFLLLLLAFSCRRQNMGQKNCGCSSCSPIFSTSYNAIPTRISKSYFKWRTQKCSKHKYTYTGQHRTETFSSSSK